jgi:hypothetical protein
MRRHFTRCALMSRGRGGRGWLGGGARCALNAAGAGRARLARESAPASDCASPAGHQLQMAAGLPKGSVSTSLASRAGLAQKSAFADPRPRRALSPPRRQPPTRGGGKTATLSSAVSCGAGGLHRAGALRRRCTLRVLPSSHRSFLLFAGRQHARGGESGSAEAPLLRPSGTKGQGRGHIPSRQASRNPMLVTSRTGAAWGGAPPTHRLARAVTTRRASTSSRC